MVKTVYLDAASNTPLDKRVLKEMSPYLRESFVGNSHSIHDFGIKARRAVEDARMKISRISGFSPNNIFFTSGATESNNWVLKSLAFHEIYEEKKPKKHLVVSAIEHASIINTCKQLEEMGFSITYVQPNKNGVITTKEVIKALRFNTLLVCVMSVNNETGVQNPVNAIGAVAHKNKSLMMSDCTQLLSYGGKQCCLKKIMPNVDYFTFSGHKIYGPTGTGCLIVKTGSPVYSFITGGGQEFGLRGGTSNTAGIVGLGEAFNLIALEDYSLFFDKLYDYLVKKLDQSNIPYKINGAPAHKNIINLNFSAFMNDTELASLLSNYGIACSAGSACDTNEGLAVENVPSHVLTAMGIPDREIFNSVRISFSKYTTKKDIDTFISVMIKLKNLQEVSNE